MNENFNAKKQRRKLNSREKEKWKVGEDHPRHTIGAEVDHLEEAAPHHAAPGEGEWIDEDHPRDVDHPIDVIGDEDHDSQPMIGDDPHPDGEWAHPRGTDPPEVDGAHPTVVAHHRDDHHLVEDGEMVPRIGVCPHPGEECLPREEEWAHPRDVVCPRLDVVWDPHRDGVLLHDAVCRPRDAMVAHQVHGAVAPLRIDVDPLAPVMDPHRDRGDVDHPHDVDRPRDDHAPPTIVPRPVGDPGVTQDAPHQANKKKLTMMDGRQLSTSVVKHSLRLI